MLPVKPFKQKKGRCGPASLKMVLEYYGVRKSENELTRLSSCTPEKGTSAENLVKAARLFGLKGAIRDFAEIKDIENYVLRKKIPVIVDWFSADEGHYSVAVGVDKKNIYLQDPERGRIVAIRKETFKKVWFDFSGDFIKSKKDIVVRRMIILSPR